MAGRDPKDKVKTEIIENITPPGIEEISQVRERTPIFNTRKGFELAVVESGLRDAIAWCIFCGLSARATANKLNLAVSTTQKYVKTPEFLQFYENHKSQLLSRVNDWATEQFQETLIWAIQEKIKLARGARSQALKNRILSELIELGLETFKGGRTSFSDELQTIWERARRRKDEKGNVVTEKVTIKGPGMPYSASSGPEIGADFGPSEVCRDEGAGEAEASPARPRLDSGNSDESD